MTKKKYKVHGMDCASCAMMIEAELEDAGVKTAKCSFADENLEVEYEESEINEEKIKEVVNETGYSISD